MSAEEDLLATGRRDLAALRSIRDRTELARTILKAVEDPHERGSMAAALYVAVLEDRHATSRSPGAASTALGVAAGLTGRTGALQDAARLSRDVRAVERTVETGNPRYVERRVKNRIVGRALGKAGVWRRLWR